jgi:hypothetical protein
MTAEQFTYWLQGFMEIEDPQTLTKQQTQVIKDHLKLVFDKQTPDRTNPMFSPSTVQPFNPVWQEPHRINPFDVTCETSKEPKKLDKSGPTIFC